MFRYVKKNPLPEEYVSEAIQLRQGIEKMSKRDILDLASSYYQVEPYTNKLYLIHEPEYTYILTKMIEGYVYPSWFIKYRSCARRFYLYIRSLIELNGYYPVGFNGLKSLLIGKLLHELYALKYGHIVEKRLELVDTSTDPPVLLIGKPDDIVFTDDGRIVIYELKAGFNLSDFVGASLQAYCYQYILSKNGYDNVVAYVVWLKGAILVDVPTEYFLEYYKRVRTIINLALQNNDIPPRLTGKYMEKRCRNCSFRGQCLQQPDPYNGDWNKFFRKHGLKPLKQRTTPTSLFSKLGV